MKHELLTATDEVALARQFRLGTHIDVQSKRLRAERGGASVTNADVAASLGLPEDQVALLLERGQAAKKAWLNKIIDNALSVARHVPPAISLY